MKLSELQSKDIITTDGRLIGNIIDIVINDGNIDKYMKAIELANLYNLPLIELKKDN